MNVYLVQYGKYFPRINAREISQQIRETWEILAMLYTSPSDVANV